MKAVVYTKYGPPDVLELREVEKPSPRHDEVLAKVHCTSVAPLDWRFRSGKFPARIMSGLLRPRASILGTEFSGEIESVGEGVKWFKRGDPVFALVKGGAYAEYMAVPETAAMAAKPATMSTVAPDPASRRLRERSGRSHPVSVG